MKRFLRCLMFLVALCVAWATNAQTLGDYTFTTGVDSTQWVTLTDYTDISGTGSGDSWYSTAYNIGFTFPFGENTYTQFSVNSDGNLRLGATPSGGYPYSSPFSSSNAASHSPKINFFGCDGYLVTGTHYVYGQTFGDTMLVVEFCLGPYSSTYRNEQFRWQVQLHSNGTIQVVFATTQGSNSSNTHQMGMCIDATDGWVINSSNQAVHFTSGSSDSWGSTTWPTGNYYTFTRPVISCPRPTAPVVSNIDMTTATVTWTPGDTTQTNFVVAYGMGTDPDSLTQLTATTTNVTLTGLNSGSDYNVFVKAVCGTDDESAWSNMTTFATNICAAADMCNVTVNMNDSYGDGWNGGEIVLYDTTANRTLHTFSLSSGHSATESVAVCNGHVLRFVWTPGGYPSEVSFDITDAYDNNLYSATSPSTSLTYIYTASCTAPSCMPVQNLTVSNVTGSTADVNWSINDTASHNYRVAWGITGSAPDTMPSATTDTTYHNLGGFSYGVTYDVYVKTLCASDNESDWVGPVTFTTPACAAEDQCVVTIEMADVYGDGWNFGELALVDTLTGAAVHYFAMSEDVYTETDSAYVCPGRVYNLVWSSGSYDDEVSFTLFDVAGDTIYSDEYPNYGIIHTFTATCANTPEPVTTVTISVNDTAMGTTIPVPGVYTYHMGDTMTASAVAAPGYHFVEWSVTLAGSTFTDTSSSLSQVIFSFLLGESISITANFAQDVIDPVATVTLSVNDSTMGTTIPAPGTYTFHLGDTMSATAVASTGYHFNSWTISNGMIELTDTNTTLTQVVNALFLNQNISVTANFSQDSVIEQVTTVTLTVNDSTMGTTLPAPGTYTFHLGDTMSVTAVAATGYHFVNWTISNGMLELTDTNITLSQVVNALFINQNISVVATFAQDTPAIDTATTCNLTVVMTDSYGDGWNGNSWLKFVDTLTNAVVDSVKLMSGSSDTAYVTVVDGHTYNLVWTSGNYDYEDGFVVYDILNTVIYTSDYLVAGTLLTYTAQCVAPSCWPVTNVTVSNIVDVTADVSWTLLDTTQSAFTVAYGTGTNPDSLTQVTATTNSITLTGLNLASTYNVYVKAVCGSDYSDWSEVVSFHTPICAAADQCYITIDMADDYGDGWNGGYISLVDSITGYSVGTYTMSSGASATDSAAVCPGRVYNLVWVAGNYDSEVSFSVYDIASTTIYSTTYPSSGTLTSFTATCTIPDCMQVQNVSVSNITDSTAEVSWTLLDTTQNNFVVAYGTGTNPDSLTQITTTTPSATLTGLSLTTVYNVFVKAVCGTDNQSSWSNAVTFVTPICAAEDQCHVTIYMTDSYGDGWNGGTLSVVDSITGSVIGSYTISSGSTAVDSAAVCPGRVYNLVWTAGNYDSEVSFVVINTALDTVLSAYYPSSGVLTSFVASCDDPVLPFTLTLATDNATMGTTNPAPNTYTYYEGDTIMVAAVEYAHYDFAYWNISYGTMTYSDSNATITMVVLPAMAGLSVTATAHFQPESYTVSATANPSALGSVTGAGVYEYGDTATLVATANANSHFVNWSDGDTNASRQLIVVSDTAVVANFAYNPLTVTIVNSDATKGTIVPAPGVYQYNVGDTATATATALTGYSFNNWTLDLGPVDSVFSANPVSIVIPTDAAGMTVTFTANWSVNNYTITALSNDTALGTVSGSGTYAYNATATLQAVANANCHFVQWNDGNTNATRTVLVTGDATYTATFAYDSITVVLAVNNAAMGTITPAAGTYTYEVGDTITASAIANSGYRFVDWNIDGTTLTDNSFSQVFSAAAAGQTLTYTATFDYDSITVVLAVNDAAMGAVTPAAGTYRFAVGDTLTAEATANEGHEFLGWSVDGNAYTSLTDNPLTQVLTADYSGQTLTYTAFFQAIPQYTVTLTVVDSLGNANVGGSVTGDGSYYVGDEVTITAIPDAGYHFVSWTDQTGAVVSTELSYSFVMAAEDVAFTAIFAADNVAIDDVATDNIVIFSLNGRVIVRGADGQTIRVFDVVGRLVAQRANAADEESIQLSNTGVYLVKVGNVSARRVVVRR